MRIYEPACMTIVWPVQLLSSPLTTPLEVKGQGSEFTQRPHPQDRLTDKFSENLPIVEVFVDFTNNQSSAFKYIIHPFQKDLKILLLLHTDISAEKLWVVHAGEKYESPVQILIRRDQPTLMSYKCINPTPLLSSHLVLSSFGVLTWMSFLTSGSFSDCGWVTVFSSPMADAERGKREGGRDGESFLIYCTPP